MIGLSEDDAKKDFKDKMSKVKTLVLSGIYQDLITGVIDGEREGLIGTLSRRYGLTVNSLNYCVGIKEDPKSPAEQWFRGIRMGAKPHDCERSSKAAEWTWEMLDARNEGVDK